MISQAAADEHLQSCGCCWPRASAGVFLHAGIKFPWFVFFQKDSGLRPPEPPLNMRLAMVLLRGAVHRHRRVSASRSTRCCRIPVDYVPYTGAHVVTQLQLLLFSGLAFFVMLPLMQRTLTITLDVDWLYRRLGPMLVRGRAR